MSLQEQIDLAADALEAGDAERAESICRSILSRNENAGPAWTNLSYALLLQGRFEEARAAAERAVALSPQDPACWHNLAECALNEGDAPQALVCNDRALALDSTIARIWSGRGSALAALARFDTAVLCFDRALKLDPGFRRAALHREIAAMLADADRSRTFHMAADIASELVARKTDQEKASKHAASMVASGQVGADLVRAFDCFVQVHGTQVEFGLAFSWLNTRFADALGVEELRQRSRETLEALLSVLSEDEQP